MKSRRFLALLVPLAFVAVLIWFAVDEKEFNRDSMKLNYTIGPGESAMITVFAPEKPEVVAHLIGFVVLPPDCWMQSKWAPKEWGRIALYKGRCRVETNAHFLPEDQSPIFLRARSDKK